MRFRVRLEKLQFPLILKEATSRFSRILSQFGIVSEWFCRQSHHAFVVERNEIFIVKWCWNFVWQVENYFVAFALRQTQICCVIFTQFHVDAELIEFDCANRKDLIFGCCVAGVDWPSCVRLEELKFFLRNFLLNFDDFWDFIMIYWFLVNKNLYWRI